MVYMGFPKPKPSDLYPFNLTNKSNITCKECDFYQLILIQRKILAYLFINECCLIIIAWIFLFPENSWQRKFCNDGSTSFKRGWWKNERRNQLFGWSRKVCWKKVKTSNNPCVCKLWVIFKVMINHAIICKM